MRVGIASSNPGVRRIVVKHLALDSFLRAKFVAF